MACHGTTAMIARSARGAWLLLALPACQPVKGGVAESGAVESPADSAEDTAGDTGARVDTADSAVACEALAPVPLEAGYLSGYTGGEDFAFDGEGYLVSIDLRGNLVGINQAGDRKVILPNATQYGAGARFLPDGDFVFCDAEKGNLIRVDPDDGVPIVVLGGLQYPNGLDVDLEGFVYVAFNAVSRASFSRPIALRASTAWVHV